MSLCPQYTPFNFDEVASVLGVSRFECERAEQVGVLERNIHFDARVSKATAMYSMVDAVKFDTARRLGWPCIDADLLAPKLDFGLDILCGIHEDHPHGHMMQNQRLLFENLTDTRLHWGHLPGDDKLFLGHEIQKALTTAWVKAWSGFSNIMRVESAHYGDSCYPR